MVFTKKYVKRRAELAGSFAGGTAVSRAARGGIIEACLREPLEPGANGKMALCPYVLL
jgi:hypothetical protein